MERVRSIVNVMKGFPDSGEGRRRVVGAKEREIAAYREAIGLHESAARLFERQGHGTRAVAARSRADQARKMLAEALVEEERATITSHPHVHVSGGLPPGGPTTAVGGFSGDRVSGRTDDKSRKGTS
jgi:hypothetical protein